jgi:hypothetical protein
MRYEIKFVTPFTQSDEVPFVGRGRLHLLETAAVFEGRQMRTYVPLVTTFVRRIIASASIRTVPYGAITEYRRRRLTNPWSYQVHFRDPDGRQRVVGFRLRAATRRDARDMHDRLTLYIAQSAKAEHK